MPPLQVDVFSKTTSRGQHRICIRFSRKPLGILLNVMKARGARYRRGEGGERACWYIAVENAGLLHTDLLTMTEDAGGEVAELRASIAPSVHVDAPEDASAQQPAPKRRRLTDGPPPGDVSASPPVDSATNNSECRACAHERLMHRTRSLGFAQHTHTCPSRRGE